MVSGIHIDDFYRDAAKILVTLYSQFPRKTTVYVEDISGPDTPDEFGLHSARHQACFETMLWLASTDYLTFEQAVFQEAIDQSVLTHRGFLTLTSAKSGPLSAAEGLPETVLKEECLTIHHLQHELKNGTSFSLAELMREVLSTSRQLGETSFKIV